MLVPEFGLNRFDWRSLDLFATDVQRAQDLGWDHALIPDSQLRRRDTYVMIAAAAQQTSRIGLGILLANPVNRHASVTASSIATVDELAPGRMLLAMGVGDTAVRLSGQRPARVAELAAHVATRWTRSRVKVEAVEQAVARLVADAGYELRRRDTLYRFVDSPPRAEALGKAGGESPPFLRG